MSNILLDEAPLLELETMIGFGGKYPKLILFLYSVTHLHNLDFNLHARQLLLSLFVEQILGYFLLIV